MTKTKKTLQTSISRRDPVDAYAIDVCEGKIIAGPHVRNACRRHIDDREKGHERGLFWDRKAANHAMGFFPDILRLNGGQFEGQKFHLHASQKFKIGSIFGWKREESDGALLRRFRRAYVEEGKGNGKALALDTPIPTPSGWTTMGDIRVGDYVFDDAGKPTKVLAATDVMVGHDCYEVVFDDGERIVADADHLWRTTACSVSAVRTTKDIAESRTRHVIGRHAIAVCRQVDSVPVRCIRIAAESSLFLAGRGMVPTHNSPLAAGIGHYAMTADGEAAAEIYAAAANKDQAFVLFRDAVAMYEQSPALKKILTPSGGNPVWNLSYLKTRSFFRPISREGAHSGPRPYVALADEIHEHPDGNVIEMLERGFKFRRQPLLFMITNSGSDRRTICWDEHQHAVKVAAGTQTPDDVFTYVGEPIDDSTFSYVCALDPGDDPFTDPTCWQKANPLFGITLKHDYLAGVVNQAKNIPSKRNGILRLHFCEWTEADTAWITRPVLEKVMADFDPYVEHKDKRITAAGLDLSGTKDLTAAAFVVETGTKKVVREDGEKVELPTYDAWVEAWTPRDTMDERSKVDHVPYRTWAESFHKDADGNLTDQPFLHAPDGQRVRYDHVAALFAKLDSECGIDVLAYDRYAYDKFAEELEDYGVALQTVAHPQGGKKRAKPAPEKVEEAKSNGDEPPLGLWMPGSVAALEELVLEERIRIRSSPVALSALMGVAMETDPLMGNQWFSKKKSTIRIDPAVALAMAVGAAVEGAPKPKTSVYKERGFLEI